MSEWGRVKSRGKRDLSEPEIAAAFEKAGAKVQPLSAEDVPDLLVGFLGVNHLVECKTDSNPLTKGQSAWHAEWAKHGEKPEVARNGAQARKLIVIWTRAFAERCRAEPNLEDDLAGQGVTR